MSENSSVNTTQPFIQHEWLSQIAWDANGLVPAIVQDFASRQVIMFAWMNALSLQETLTRGQAIYWSRSRQRLWLKGEVSGHIQKVHHIRLDCDADALLLEVEQIGGIACHTGRQRCFYRELMAGDAADLGASESSKQGHAKWVITDDVLKNPKDIYS